MCLQAASVLQGPAVLGFVVKARFLAGSESDVRQWEHMLASCEGVRFGAVTGGESLFSCPVRKQR